LALVLAFGERYLIINNKRYKRQRREKFAPPESGHCWPGVKVKIPRGKEFR
jgi:hypothetical protein